MVANNQSEAVPGIGAPVDLDMCAQEPLGQGGDRRFRFGRGREGRLTPLNAVDDDRRLAAGHIGRDFAMPSQGDALRPGRPLGLHAIDPAAGAIDPNAEAGKVRIPEDRITAFRDQCLDATLGEPDGGLSGHPSFLPNRACPADTAYA